MEAGRNKKKKAKQPQKKFSYKRIVIKLSGETLVDSQQFGINYTVCKKLAEVLIEIHKYGCEVAVVLGGGNIIRGIHLKEEGFKRVQADWMGMLATVLNGLAMEQVFSDFGCRVKILSALECPKVVETYRSEEAKKWLKEGYILFFVGGTGNPFFTTDTAAALRAAEIEADLLAKVTKVKGVYNKDPLKYTKAKRYTEITYSQFLKEKLGVMDDSSVVLCRNNEIPIFVFSKDLFNADEILSTFSNPKCGTFIRGG